MIIVFIVFIISSGKITDRINSIISIMNVLICVDKLDDNIKRERDELWGFEIEF